MLSLQSLPQPVRKLGLSELSQIVDALLAEVDAAKRHILRGSLANSLDNDGRVGLEDDAVVDNFVNRERNKVVVLDNCPLVNGLPGEQSANEQHHATSNTAYLNNRCSESLRARIVLYSRISFSSTLPTT